MRTFIRRMFLLGGAAAVALNIAVTPAMAAPTSWTVGPTTPAAFGANSTDTVFKLGYIPMTCPVLPVRGSLFSATGSPGYVGKVTSMVFGSSGSPCTTALGTVTPLADVSTPWKIMATEYHAGTGVTSGYVTGVEIRFTVLTCSGRIAGELAMTYTSSTGVMALTGAPDHQLLFTDTTPACKGLWADGEVATLTANLGVVTPAGGVVHPAITGS
ncbi:hypothetical protein ACIBI8_17230 [Streptomyces sp. NPDC050529]|uniref:hypothetical protein n=1 Tax=unclassified Streptomyces TaxID=2593676 RepID=UPI002DDA479A|nr:hypothetical protein [Streptomyces sp. NBC_01022]WRZ85899.1 hypothetical protein OG316_39290 [Streptomyces sp. NBC_01022]